MRSPFIIMLAWALLLCTAGQGLAQEVTGGSILEYGRYEITLSGDLVSQGGQDTNDVHRLTGHQLAETTDRIPIRDNVTFGYDWMAQGQPEDAEIPITLLLIYPDGRMDRGFDATAIGSAHHTSLTIHDLDMPEGRYVLAVHYQGKRLVSRDFNLYKP